MSTSSRFVLLILIAILLIAAIVSIVSEDSPLKAVSILIITIIGALSALAQFTGTDVFRKLIKEVLPKSRKIISKELLLKYLVARHLIGRCEAVGRRPLYQVDNNYWTNLVLDFPKLARESDTLDLCANCVRSLLSSKSDRVFVVEPLDLGESQPDVRQTIVEIVGRVSGQFVRVGETHVVGQVVVLAGVFSSQIKGFLLQKGAHISTTIFLVGPDSDYLSEIFIGLPFKVASIVSIDTLQELDIETRRSILWHSV